MVVLLTSSVLTAKRMDLFVVGIGFPESFRLFTPSTSFNRMMECEVMSSTTVFRKSDGKILFVNEKRDYV